MLLVNNEGQYVAKLKSSFYASVAMPPVRSEVFAENIIFCLASLGEPQHVQTSSLQLFFFMQSLN